MRQLIFFAAKVSETKGWSCLQLSPDLTAYAVFRRYKNGNVNLLKSYKTMAGASSQAHHRNGCHMDRHHFNEIEVKNVD